MSGPGFRCPRCECLCQYCGHADVPGVPHVSVFASWLRRFMDEACTYSRAEWTEILGVPATAISQWVSDEAFPSAEALRRLRAMMVEEETTPAMGVFLADFDGLASQPMSRIAPKWGEGPFLTLAHYMVRPVREAFLELLDTLPVERQERALIDATRALRSWVPRSEE